MIRITGNYTYTLFPESKESKLAVVKLRVNKILPTFPKFAC